MCKRVLFCLTAIFLLSVNTQAVNLQGTVTNRTGKPISGAVVTLVHQAMKYTTGADGRYSFVTATGNLPSHLMQGETFSIENGVIHFTLNHSSPLVIEVFDLKGTLHTRKVMKNAAAGKHDYDIASYCKSNNLLIIKAIIRSRVIQFRYMPMNGGKSILSMNHSASSLGKQARIIDVLDTLIVTAPEYKTQIVPVTSYENQQQNITLDSIRQDYHYMGNPPGPSVGCGKQLSDLSSGTYSITSAGLSRRYIIDIPANYDPNKPYRLIFGMHYMCGSMEAIRDNKFYELKKYADASNTPCIFVAPSAYSTNYSTVAQNCVVWNQEAKDHIFFDDMLKLFKEKLCIDTTRVFSAGFSFGAMYTYSLSANHQKQLRAVACWAPANWNIYQPTNTHEPIAYYQATGTKDGTCKWVNNDARKEGGKYCLLNHIQNNGCTVPSNIPLATGSTHISTEFSGCMDGYPVKFSSFVGAHTDQNMDPGTNINWLHKEAWDFFMQF